MWLIPLVSGVVNAVSWTVYVATLNPTIGGALLGVFGTLTGVALNAWLISRHEARMTNVLDKRRLVVANIEGAVIMTEEERRELENDLALELRGKRSKRSKKGDRESDHPTS